MVTTNPLENVKRSSRTSSRAIGTYDRSTRCGSCGFKTVQPTVRRSGETQAMRPLLLLDVDGVLMPLGRSVPPGYERHVTESSNLVAAAQHGVRLRELSEIFEIVWATTWGDSANDTFGELFGLPRFDFVRLGEMPRHGTRKLGAVQAFAGSRPVAWVDDELYEDALAWADGRADPTLLVRPAPYVGLTEAHFASLKQFAISLIS